MGGEIALPDNPRVLLVRLTALGDTVNTLPVACALKRRYPGATLVWATAAANAPLLEGHRAVDEVVALPRDLLFHPGQLFTIGKALQKRAFHVALDPQSLSKSAIVAWLSGATKRVGFASPWGRELSLVLNNVFVSSKPKNATLRYVKILEPLGIDHPEIEFALPVFDQAAESVDKMLRAMRLGDGFALVSAGAGWDSKQWPVERYAETVRHLAQRRSMPTIVVWGNDRERERAVAIAEPARGAARLAPKLTLPELAELARRARFMLASDTGPLHLAAAVGTPCVALFGPTDPALTGPYGDQHIVVSHVVEDLGRDRKRRGMVSSAMALITAADAIAACDQALVMPIRGRTSALAA